MLLSYFVYWFCFHSAPTGVYPEMLGRTSGVTSLHRTKKKYRINIFAQTVFELQLENVTLAVRMWFMCDGAASHFKLMCAGCAYSGQVTL